jgi:hypothetical protein
MPAPPYDVNAETFWLDRKVRFAGVEIFASLPCGSDDFRPKPAVRYGLYYSIASANGDLCSPSRGQYVFHLEHAELQKMTFNVYLFFSARPSAKKVGFPKWNPIPSLSRRATIEAFCVWIPCYGKNGFHPAPHRGSDIVMDFHHPYAMFSMGNQLESSPRPFQQRAVHFGDTAHKSLLSLAVALMILVTSSKQWQ